MMSEDSLLLMVDFDSLDEGHEDYLVEDIKTLWMQSGSLPPIPSKVLEYLQCKLTDSPTGVYLMQEFSRDGLNIIPSLAPEIPRIDLLEAVRKVFDGYMADSDKGVEKDPLEPTINEDERNIIGYIAGFILQRLRRRARRDDEISAINKLIQQERTSEGSNSLISILQNDDYGLLTVPKAELVDILVDIELKFRKNFANRAVLTGVLPKLSVSVYAEHLKNSVPIDLITKITKYFLKIRCHQKAKTINSKFNTKHDQNMSLRKSLKGKSK